MRIVSWNVNGLRAAAIHPEVPGSDHCPISVEVDPGILGG